jgi:hypothetical protein
MKSCNFFDQFTEEEVVDWLKDQFYRISEDVWMANWIVGLERKIWDLVHHSDGHLSHIDRTLILQASDKIGGWIKWDNLNQSPVFITKEKWLLECISNNKD